MTTCSVYNGSLVYRHESGQIILPETKLEYTYPVICLSYIDSQHILICDSSNKAVCYRISSSSALWEIILDEAPHSISVNTNSYFIYSQTSLYRFSLDGTYSKIFKIPNEDLHIVQVYPIPENKCICSTYKRTYFIDNNTPTPIGSRERRGDFGACYIKDNIYCARPNNYLWKAIPTGEVLATLQFKLTTSKVNFGVLYEWEGLMVSYDGNDIMFIDLDTGKFISIEHINCKLYYNYITRELYRIKDNMIQVAVSLSVKDKLEDYLKAEQFEEAMMIVLRNAELHSLELLSDLCYKVFIQKVKLDEKLYQSFAELISKLESGETITLNFKVPNTEEASEYFDYRLKDKQNERLRKKQALHRRQLELKERRSEKMYVRSWIQDCGFNTIKEVISILNLDSILQSASKYLHSKEVRNITMRVIISQQSYSFILTKNYGLWLIECIYQEIAKLEEYKHIARLSYDTYMIQELNRDIDKLIYNATHLI
jgi:hypothetical protein